MWYDSLVKFDEFEGKTVINTEIKGQDEELHFYFSDGTHYKMFHIQDCCEHVWLEDVVGDLDDLLGETILKAREETEDGNSDWGSQTWTFYHITTDKGTDITLRWCGESNGYYSESVEITKVE